MLVPIPDNIIKDLRISRWLAKILNVFLVCKYLIPYLLLQAHLMYYSVKVKLYCITVDFNIFKSIISGDVNPYI